jgi:hypothetical protein
MAGVAKPPGLLLRALLLFLELCIVVVLRAPKLTTANISKKNRGIENHRAHSFLSVLSHDEHRSSARALPPVLRRTKQTAACRWRKRLTESLCC